MKKLLPLAIVALLTAGTASADSIYINVGNDYDSSDNAQSVTDKTTGWFDALQFTYDSETVFSDANNDGFFSAGDTLSSTAGMGLAQTFGALNGSVTTNLNGGFYPGENGFGDVNGGWAITFGITNLTGQVISTGPNPTDLSLQYNSGTLSMYFYEYAGILGANDDISGDLVHLMDLNIFGGAPDGDSTNFSGDITTFGAGNVNGVAAGDVFNIAYGNDVKTFSAASVLDGGLRFNMSNDTQGDLFGAYAGGAGSTQNVTGQHEGSVAFAVPEPTSLAILGLGLLGFAGTRRRKA
jgi:hypothetical protein